MRKFLISVALFGAFFAWRLRLQYIDMA